MLLTSAITLSLVTLGLCLLQFYRARREFFRTLDELPTGLCAVGPGDKIIRWNRQMTKLSGIHARDSVGLHINLLPAPWPEALREALGHADEAVIKKAIGRAGDSDTRWIMLHSSAPGSAEGRRQIMVEDITDYQRLQDELLHQERLASIGRLAAGVAHEIGNPVTGIACVAQNLAASADPAELQQGTAEILKQTGRISRTVGSLMQLSHPGSVAGEAECVPCNLADCIDEAIHLLRLDRDAPEGMFQNTCDREVLVSADGQLLLQVFLNLLDNARSGAAGEGPVTVSASNDNDSVYINVDNPGPAIPATVQSQLFEPFYTTKDVGEGTGLGLPLARRAMEDMGGSISVNSPIPGEDQGVRACLTLNRAEYATTYSP
ncbi:MAG: hypothetical protein Cons2KO_32210 [Congregibacter sp.]